MALSLRGRAVLVLGGGAEAAEKVPRLLAAGARVTLVSQAAEPALVALAQTGELTWFGRTFLDSDVYGARVVLLTEIDEPCARALRALADRHHFWLCTLDQPAFSDFFLVSTFTRGPVQIAISTGGRAPLLARRLRQALERGLDERFGEFARSFAELRARVRGLTKGARSEVLERALSGFAMEVSLRYPEPEGHAGHPPDQAREP